MKKLLLITAVLASLTAVSQNNRSSWALNITSKTTKAYLDSVSTAWAGHGIVLKFTDLKFNSKGTKLLQVSGNIDYTTPSGEHMTAQISEGKIKKQIEIRINDKPSISVNSK